MATLFRFIKNVIIKFFKFLNFIRLFILNALFFVLLLFIFASFDNEQEAILVNENSFLRIDLNGSIVEHKQAINLSQEVSKQLAGMQQELPEEFIAQELIQTIRYAQSDEKITGIILELTGLASASLDQLTDIGEAINQFKTSGKPVYAYSDNYSQAQYYLASYATQITLPPNGLVMLQGYAVNSLYFKELLDNLLITPHVFKVGTYKSFVEPFTESKMSDYSKEANKHWLDQIWSRYIARVLEQRKNNDLITAEAINPDLAWLKDKLLAVKGDSSEYALSVGLVDQLDFYDHFMNNLTQNNNSATVKSSIVNYQHYQTFVPPVFQRTGKENQIAVIYGSGEIISGYSDNLMIADKNFIALLKQAINDKGIKAVVLRLDTPGGSAFASENIRQQVLALKAAGKKVVVSMGSVTASGGYWIASAADKIIASPTTLTGSIGIFGMFATIDKSLEKLGIHHDGVATNPLSNVSLTQPLSPELAALFQIAIEDGYDDFLKVVSEGRNMSVQDVNKVAQGRVWTGEDGVNNGLVDELGNLDTAIKLAAKLADLKDFDLVSIEPKVSSKQAFLNQLFSKSISLLPSGIVQQSELLSLLTKIESQTSFIKRINDPQSRYVYCTTCSIK
jgi:protease-4